MKLHKNLLRQLLLRNIKKTILLLFLFFLAVVVLIPFFLMISTSLKTPAEVNATVFKLIPRQPHFVNYARALSRGNWFLWFINTAFVALVVTIASLLFNSMTGYAFARLKFSFSNILFYTIILGLMIAPQLKIVPTFIIMKHFPLAGGNNILGQGGTGIIDTYAGLMVHRLAGCFGIFLCRQYYLNFPKALDDAAELDACTVWKTYWNIYIPNSKPVLASLAVLKITGTWNDYIWPLIVTQSKRIMTVQLGLALFKDEIISWELLMAATSVVMFPLIVVFFFTQKFFVSGMITSGIKG